MYLKFIPNTRIKSKVDRYKQNEKRKPHINMSTLKSEEKFCWICLLVFYDQKTFNKHGCDREEPPGIEKNDSDSED